MILNVKNYGPMLIIMALQLRPGLAAEYGLFRQGLKCAQAKGQCVSVHLISGVHL